MHQAAHGYRNKPLSEREKRGNTTRSKVRARVEHVFGAQSNDMGGTLVRSIGMVRARARIGLKNLADLVMSLGRANWAEKLVLKAAEVIKAPSDIDVAQLSMLKVNPATAQLMLTGAVTLEPGGWVIQNAANSAVGVNLIRLAKASGLKTVNVVRRESLIEPLQAIGANVVLVDSPDLALRAAAATGGADIKLGIDAVAGAATERLADCLAEQGTVVNYGLLSGDPCQLRADQTIFKGITLTGFWLAKQMRTMTPAALAALYGDLMSRIADGSLHVDVEAVYGLEDIKAALDHASREARSGKVLITPNGPSHEPYGEPIAAEEMWGSSGTRMSTALGGFSLSTSGVPSTSDPERERICRSGGLTPSTRTITTGGRAPTQGLCLCGRRTRSRPGSWRRRRSASARRRLRRRTFRDRPGFFHGS